MRRSIDLVVWTVLGLAGFAFLLWVFPLIYPFYPQTWTESKQEAEATALEQLRDLGPPVENPLVVTNLVTGNTLEERLLEALPAVGVERLRGDMMAREILYWQVSVYPPGARTFEWTYRALVSSDGQVVDLQRRVAPEEPAGDIEAAEARRRGEALLVAHGYDLERFGEPVARRTERQARTDLALRYPAKDRLLGDLNYGVEALFAGDQLVGFASFLDDPDRTAIQARLQPVALLSQLRLLMPVLLFPVVALFFLFRYHAGEVGVRRAVQIFLVSYAAALVLMLLAGATSSEGVNFGLLSRRQMVFAFPVQLLMLWFPLLATVAALSWSVGEAVCREGWGSKLAAFDALFQRRWGNATFARDSLRGVMAGCALVGGLHLALWLLPDRLVAPRAGILFGPWWESAAWPGVALLAFCLCYTLYSELFARFFLLSTLSRRVGVWAAGTVVALLSAVVFWPIVGGAALLGNVLLGLVAAAVLVLLFLRYGLLTTLLASLMASAATGAAPFLLADDRFLQFQGVLPLFVVALPMLVSLRYLGSGREFLYRYEDVPPHVRRIAERERQRVELETARNIQSSILPDLPEQLNGVLLSHAYRPASEVGGDFYDVLALEDGRLAVAVGDVAGHGVSSGLVMSMAKSALAVQVAFNPSVPDVFRTLNRTVFQTARKRLLATLCYAIVDPRRLEMLYASAGHLFPYRIKADGRVDALESVSYPLGVREDVEMLPKEARLAAGDTLFLFSDGIIEARREGSDEMFGFERLEESLQRHAHLPVDGLRDAVFTDVERFTGPVPREDDQTVLVLRLPLAS